jgi:hypothetical protein
MQETRPGQAKIINKILILPLYFHDYAMSRI